MDGCFGVGHHNTIAGMAGKAATGHGKFCISCGKGFFGGTGHEDTIRCAGAIHSGLGENYGVGPDDTDSFCLSGSHG